MFIRLALKANPNVLECLYSPLVERCTPLPQELIAQREIFLWAVEGPPFRATETIVRQEMTLLCKGLEGKP